MPRLATRLRRPAAGLGAFALGLAFAGAAQAAEITRTLEADDETELLTVYAVDSSCAPAALPSVTASPSPRLGRLKMQAGMGTASEGACAGREVETLTVVYSAQSEKGVDLFTLTVSGAASGDGAHDVAITVHR
ncbi:hypothetical protein P2H44_18480 [Albimonas sp. CAU 1670]|uniref:hypothetical protein n=1 Tax=Albimonas sp. CAU 1670 TaxID=3032599 RepID=UPI0023DBA676|nr:hypothetical protein [Albimonas sp. CAU 1670]MDF2234551.1 hypothetical protein [Albimonas sp. CAU 1670]